MYIPTQDIIIGIVAIVVAINIAIGYKFIKEGRGIYDPIGPIVGMAIIGMALTFVVGVVVGWLFF